MSSSAEEIELLERVLFRLGTAETDEKLEAAVGKFLTPVLLKITSPHENVRAKVMEVLTHLNKRLKSRPQVQIPVELLLSQYIDLDSSFLHNFSIIYITMGFPRLPIEKQTELAPKLLNCIEGSPDGHQDKILLMILPLLGEIKFPVDVADRKTVLGLDKKPNTKKLLYSLMQDVLLLPYGVTQDAELPPGFSVQSFKRIIANSWKAEDLEQLKKAIVRFICCGALSDLDAFILLVLASSDTRFSVATPAIAELSKVCTTLDFTDPQVTAPLYTLFSGNGSKVPDRKTTPCSTRVRQKLLHYLIKCRGRGLNAVKGIQVIFEGLFGENTNQKCKVLSLQFCEMLMKEGQKDIVERVSKVILTGLSKLIGKESTETVDVQNAAYSAMAQLSRSFPDVINQDLKIVVSYFNNLSTAPIELHTSIREALIAMAPAFAWNYQAMETESTSKFQLTSQQNLLLAMLSDNAESKLQIVQNVTSFFLMTCFPDHFAPSRFLLLLIAGERSSSLHEAVSTYLYGVSKKDHMNYNMISSVDYPQTDSPEDYNKLSSEERRVVLPGFKEMINYACDVAKKRLTNSSQKYVTDKTVLAFHPNVYCEILDYLRLCLWYSSGARCRPGDEKQLTIFNEYIRANYNKDESNEITKYLQLIKTSIEAKREDTNLLCLYDLLNAVPEKITKNHVDLLEPLSLSLKDVAETLRISVAQVYGILLAYGLSDDDFNRTIDELRTSLPNRSLENRHGIILAFGHAFSMKIRSFEQHKGLPFYQEWSEFVKCLQLIVSLLVESQVLLVSAAIKSLSLIAKVTELPEFEVTLQKKSTGEEEEKEEEMDVVEEVSLSAKELTFQAVFVLIGNSNVRARIREDAATCLGNLAIGDGKHFTKKNLEKFLGLIKTAKDAALNIAIAQAIVFTINGYDTNVGPPDENFVNANCDDATLEWFLKAVIKFVPDPNPHSRQACGVWLLAIVKNCANRAPIVSKKQLLQYAFTELLSDDSDFVQDVASRGLGLVYSLSDPNSQNDLANSLLDQLIGGKRQVAKIDESSEIFAEGSLGKTPMGGNITTYKELCGLASDLNKPEMIYQFMQLANHNAKWNSKLGAAFGLKSISKEAKIEMQPYLGKIVPRLYRYKYDPTPKIQNSMISIWDAVVSDTREVVELFYWDILKEILANMTENEWRNRIACCLAVRDLLKRPTGLRLRSEEKPAAKTEHDDDAMEVDNVPEPELRELWSQLFRVMDDFHEGTRLAAEGTAKILSKICVVSASSNHGKSGLAVASSILPLFLNEGVTHTVPEIRRLSIKTISELIDSSGALITPHLPSLVPCLLRATGELETPKLSYLSTRLSGESEAQEAVDSIRAEAAKSHHTMETLGKCVRHIDYDCLQKMTPAVLELVKTTVILGTKIACAHFICLISIRIGQEMQPLVGKYLAACLIGLKDKNMTVRKYYASAIGHLTGIAKEQSIKNLFTKIFDLYNEEPLNRGVPLIFQSINKRHHDLLKDYVENVFPLIFFAMHEEINDENRGNVELWKELWIEISPGDAGIRMNLSSIVPVIEKALEDASWPRKTQAGNAINTIATRLGTNLDEEYRMRLINLLLSTVPGRTFQGKERLLQALASLCKGLKQDDPVCVKIVDIVMKECRKEEPQYRTHSLKALGDILEEVQIDRFEDVYNMVWYLLDKKSLQTNSNDDDDIMEMTTDERTKRVNIFSKLKETVCDTIGKSWPKNSLETQQKYQQIFIERCANCLRESTRPVQISLLIALGKFIDRLKLFEDTPDAVNVEKKQKTEIDRDTIKEKICGQVLDAVFFASSLPHTGLKKESLNIILTLIKRLTGEDNRKHLERVKTAFEENLAIFEKDGAPEVRCRIKDIEDKLRKL